MKPINYPTNSLMLDDDTTSLLNRAARRAKRKKVRRFDVVHKAKNGKVYVKGNKHEQDKQISGNSYGYDERFS